MATCPHCRSSLDTLIEAWLHEEIHRLNWTLWNPISGDLPSSHPGTTLIAPVIVLAQIMQNYADAAVAEERKRREGAT